MRQAVILCLLISLSACLKMTPRAVLESDAGTFFPVKKYMLGQYQQYAGQPYPIYRIITVNGKVDTTLSNFLDLDYPAIAAPFIAGDISDTAFINEYEASEFKDELTGNHTVLYTAKSARLYNQTTLVSLDAENNHVASLFMKNVKAGRFSSHTQNLTYIPHSYLQIQDDESATPGGARSLRVEYRFLKPSNDEGPIQ